MLKTKVPLGVVAAFGASTGPPAGSAPVLVIDDEPAGADTTCGWLAHAGCPTACETDGDAVMRLVVSELYIPGAEGACVVTTRKQERTPLSRLRVLAHTRHPTPADDPWALAAGCDGVLHQPGWADALVREVRRPEGGSSREPGSGPDDAGGRP